MAELPRAFNDVVCGLLHDSGRVLLVHRNASRAWAPNCWDAPGGHIEMGESDFDALRRELREELGVQVTPDKVRVVGRLVDDDYDARIFLVDAWSGEPENRAPHEHDDLAWFEESDLEGLALADPEILEIAVRVLHAPS